MKKILILFILSMTACSPHRPKVYPDLFDVKLNERGLFHSKHRIFWKHTFKTIAANSYSAFKKDTIQFDKSTKLIYIDILKMESYKKADSIGILASKRTSHKFESVFYFFDSDYLEKEAERHFKLYKKSYAK